MAELKQEWINVAIEALDKVYIPYSRLPVGACPVTESGKIYQGISTENASFKLASCTECIAFFRAVSEGGRSFTHLVVAGHTLDSISPCGACRRVMAEFCAPDMSVMLVGGNGVAKATTVRELLPYISTEKGL